MELAAVGEVARGQLRLRPRQQAGTARVQRPAARAPREQPESGDRAERTLRPRHPAARGVREALGRGETPLSEAGVTRHSRSSSRLDLTTPGLLGLPIGWLL